ncbi:MAG: hypothetical protein QHH05_08180, partial [Syntrophomonadaceae bacterium]|nr:hypothetical protein [Syntrophomonadaceae bacterium]
MPCHEYVLYVAWNGHKYRMGLSPNPQVDLSFLQRNEHYEEMAYVSSPLPLALAEYLLEQVARPAERVGKEYGGGLRLPFLGGPRRAARALVAHKFRQVRR